MTKATAISLMILEAKNRGLTIAEALDEVCGDGTYDKLVSELYDELRAAK